MSFNANFVKNHVFYIFGEFTFHCLGQINQILFLYSYILTHQVLVKTAILAQNKEGNTSFVAKLLGEDYSVTFWLSYLVALVGTGRQEII